MTLKIKAGFALFVAAFLALALGFQTVSAQEADPLDQLLAELDALPEGTPAAFAKREEIINHVLGLGAAPEPPRDFRRYMVRGEMALELAADEKGFARAAEEFQAATLEAPWQAEAYLNLARAEEQAGNPGAAARAYKLYLLAAPTAVDFAEVEEQVFRLEYQAELEARGDIPRQPEPEGDPYVTDRPVMPEPGRVDLLFFKRPAETPEPRNMDDIADVVPTLSSFSKSGKILVAFDIDERGRTENFRILGATKVGDYDDEARMVVDKMRFDRVHAGKRNVIYDLTFCKRTDRVRKLICEITFEDLTADKDHAPRLLNFAVPNYNTRAAGKGICGAVNLRFDVGANGTVTSVEVITTEGGGMFGFNAKEALELFTFEEGRPMPNMEYRIGFGLPGECEAH